MKCKQCGSEEFYVRGKYRRCVPCHNKAQAARYRRLKLGMEKERRSRYKARPLSEALRSPMPPSPDVCRKGHELNDETTRLDIDSKGRIHRRCKKCEVNYGRKFKYGLQVPSRLSELMSERDNPWDQIQ